MTYFRWTIRILLVLVIGGFLHYTLPQRDIVRIVNTYEERQDFGGISRFFWSAGSAGTGETPRNRDVLFIQTVKADGETMVYRNEDTGWGWPPYFKFDTSNLQTEAADLKSTKDNPQWVAVTHYGWRNEFLSIFPNAVAVRPVDSPDVRLFPWTNIVILTILALLAFWAWRIWRHFRRRFIDPLVEGAEDRWDATAESRGRLGSWWDRLRGR